MNAFDDDSNDQRKTAADLKSKENIAKKSMSKNRASRILEEDEDEKEQIQKMKTAAKERFGHQVKFDKYRTSNVIKIICITLAIIIIPLEIFVQNVLQDKEAIMIQSFQTHLDGSQSFMKVFMNIPLVLVTPQVTVLFMILLYLATDSLIAFKSSLLTCFGIYIITFLKLLYKDGRPFWVENNIKGYSCSFDFAGPSYHLFIMMFFWAYNLVMYCMKYAEEVNYTVVYGLGVFIFFMSCWIIVGGLYTGSIFIYQGIIGALYGLIYLVLCMNFDTEIHRMCEKTGFIVQSSRKYKFYLFFMCIGLFVVSLIYYNSELDQWTMPQAWVINATNEDHLCREQLLSSNNNRLGLD
jgi:hypothetical protein